MVYNETTYLKIASFILCSLKKVVLTIWPVSEFFFNRVSRQLTNRQLGLAVLIEKWVLPLKIFDCKYDNENFNKNETYFICKGPLSVSTLQVT